MTNETPQKFVRPHFGYRRHRDQDLSRAAVHPVVIVGGGLVGLTLALDLRKRGVDVVVIEKGDTVSEGSRSICQAKRTLEIWDRLGVGDAVKNKGVQWGVGRVFCQEDELYSFDLQPEPGYKMPAFVNLQQYYCELYLLDALREAGGDVRWGQTVETTDDRGDHVAVTVATPDGPYRLEAEWLVACDGAKSSVRRAMGLQFGGKVFQDKFLICDVRMSASFPSERWFWFDPPFHDGQTALLHRQADDVWRIDLQLDAQADADVERDPAHARRRISAMLGPDARFKFEWISVYAFQCRTLDRYRHGRIVFAGDAAHQVSPFGARGGNGGVQDADNLGWKLHRVLDGASPAAILDTYCEERRYAADINIGHSTRATDFMTPKTRASRRLRDETLELARHAPFARALVNSGRLSEPAVYENSRLNTSDTDQFLGGVPPGAPALDAPLRDSDGHDWFTERFDGRFMVLVESNDPNDGPRLEALGDQFDEPLNMVVADDNAPVSPTLRERYDLKAGTTYLFRPDGHVAGRWRSLQPEQVSDALRRAACLA